MYWILRLSGMKLIPFAEPNMYRSDELNAPPAIIYANVVIVLSTDFITSSGSFEIRAVVLHEQAHAILKHKLRKLISQKECYDQEFAADEYVKKAGYGSALARVLHRYSHEATKYHPSTAERISRLIGE